MSTIAEMPTIQRVALVGYGYWGPNLLRNLVHHGGFTVVGVVDEKEDARDRVKRLYPNITLYRSLRDLLAEKKLDAVCIATPPSTHESLALEALAAGAHVFVEKPLALSVAQCDRILSAARRYQRKVMVDHTFVYNPAVEYLAQKVGTGGLGKLLYYDSVRVNLGGYQFGADVIWDLAPHDLSILDYLLHGKMPLTISATGASHFGQRHANLAYCHLQYADDFVAHLHLNWIAPVKVRTIMLGGTQSMAVYDENMATEKIRVYNKGIVLDAQDHNELRVSYRVGDMFAPALSSREALAASLTAFHRYLTLNEKPASDGEHGKRVVKILEAATLSLSNGGFPVVLETRERPRELAA